MNSQQNNAQLLLGTAYFDSTGNALNSESEIVLASIADRMNAEPNLKIDIHSYTNYAGSPAENIAISKTLAEIVKSHLTLRLRHSSDRVQTFGYGADNPNWTNTTDEGTDGNHKVEIMIRKPDALLTWFENDVQVQPPSLRPHWLKPAPNYFLYHDYRVATGKNSSAHIFYPDHGTLQIGEEAMVIIQGSNLEQKENSFVKNLELQDGGLKGILEDAASQDDSVLINPDVMRELNAQSKRTQVDEKLESLIAAYQGDPSISVASAETLKTTADSTTIRQSINDGLPTGFALGVMIGQPTGITLKNNISRKTAIDFKIGWSFPGGRFHVAGDYLIYFPEWAKREGWYPYLGVGGRFRTMEDQEERQLNLGIRVGIGIEYLHQQLGLFGEFYPVVDLAPEASLNLEGGIGVRYYFKN